MSEKPTYKELERQIEELRNAERDLKMAQQRLSEEIAWRRLLIEQSRDGIVILDQNGKVFEANQQFANLLGYSLDELFHLYVWDWDTRFSQEDLLDMIASIDSAGHHFETRHKHKDGSIVEVELSNNGILFGGKKLIFCIVRDITERKKAQAEKERLIREIREMNLGLEELSIKDPLTDVFNRRSFDSCYEKEIYRARRSRCDLSVLMIDVDRFKGINDRLGHPCGDRCLVGVTKAIGKNLKRPSDYLARYGGDEFVVILPETRSFGVNTLAEKIRRDVERLRIQCKTSWIGLTVSIGVANFYAGENESDSALLARADIALYEAKARGGNQVVADYR